MSARGTIAVVVGKGKDILGNDMIEGIINQAKKLGYNVAIFSVFAFTNENTKHQYGENNIYTLLKSECIVGVIYVEYSIEFSKECYKKILKLLKRFDKKRVVILDGTDDHGYKALYSEDLEGMEAVTDHLIEKHSCRDLICLTGPMENVVSMMRIQGFINSLKKHGIKIDPDNIIEGDFWIGSATKLADDIAEHRVPLPDGVVCCNYKMTTVLVNELSARGIRVPDLFPVVGYDFTAIDSSNNDMNVTIHTRPEKNLGARCVCYIHKSITGREVSPYTNDHGRLIIADSCGCKKKSTFYRKTKETLRDNNDYAEAFRMKFMQEDLMSCENLKQLFRKIRDYFDLLKNLEGYDLCVNEKWNMYDEKDQYRITDGYEAEMIDVLSYSKGNSCTPNIKYALEDLLPPTIDSTQGPKVCFFSPVHFNDHCLGYQIAQFKNDIYDTSEEVYHSWSSCVSIAMEYLRMKDHMQMMYNKVYISSIRDNMTGLYNRKAYEMYKDDVFEYSKRNECRLLIITVDMNNLKKINDTFGHIEGDAAIRALANAINTCCSFNEFCIRNGGDEFIVFGSYEYEDEIPKYYEARIRAYLKRYNNYSDKPYKVEASVGIFFGHTKNYKNFDACLKLADKEMYKEKKLSKKKQEDGV